ncbi:MAG TPA: CHAT domain-containing protein, partial [Thermoanaerobaculia bacterium]
AGRTPRTPGRRGMPFAPLPWSDDEARKLASLASDRQIATIRLDAGRATKAAVLAQVGAATFVHLATHGFVPEGGTDAPARTPLVNSGLALSGANVRDPVTLQGVGILTAEEILDADLGRARLVVLSACNTGLGVKASGQGLLGLRSALYAAGARRVVMSLWPVDDEATKVLMSSFYERLWGEGKPLLQAFHEAQKAVRSDERFREPRFWAGWSIVDPE